MAVNIVILQGNVVKDVELRSTPSGNSVVDLRIAVDTSFGKGDERKEKTSFFDVDVWGKQAETCAKYLSKGRSVLVEGRLEMDIWEDKETGKKRSKTKIIARNVAFLGSPKKSDDDGKEEVDEKEEAPSKELPF